MAGATGIVKTLTTAPDGTGSVSFGRISGVVLALRVEPADGTTPAFTLPDGAGIDLIEDAASGDDRRIPTTSDGLEPVDEEIEAHVTGGGNAQQHRLTLYVWNNWIIRH